jgi:hypothetical protein
MDEPPRRVNYTTGMILGVEDFEQEQAYHRRMRYLDNRLHGYGVVDGLQVSVDKDCVRVGPGLAIDAQGRELVVGAPLCLQLGTTGRRGEYHLVVTWAESPDRPVPGPDGADVFTRWVERPELSLASPSDPPAESLVLARISFGRRGVVTVDESVRRPLGPDPVPGIGDDQPGGGPRRARRVALLLGGVAVMVAARRLTGGRAST